jgi:hypothetical protein
MTLDLNQIHVESFDVSPELVHIAPIVSTDEVPNCNHGTGDC